MVLSLSSLSFLRLPVSFPLSKCQGAPITAKTNDGVNQNGQPKFGVGGWEISLHLMPTTAADGDGPLQYDADLVIDR